MDPNCLTLMVFLQEVFEKMILKKISRRHRVCKVTQQAGKEVLSYFVLQTLSAAYIQMHSILLLPW